MKPSSKKAQPGPGRKPTQSSTEPSESESSSNNEATIEKFLHLILSSGEEESTKLDITHDVVKRVSKGSLGELLTFLGERLVGRDEVRRVRKVIHATPSGNGKDGELEKARRRLRGARVAVDVAMKERGEARIREGGILKEKNELEEKVSRERRLGNVFEDLKSRETVRMKRIEEVKKMMHQLRKKVEEAKEAGKFGMADQRIHSMNLRAPQWRPKDTRETVAKLHAYHIRLNSGNLAEAQGEKIKQAEEKLRNVMRKKLGRELGDDELKELLTRCRGAAETQVEKGWGYADLVRDKGAEERLERSIEEVRIKEAKIAGTNEEIVAKLFLVEKHLQTVQAFQEYNAASIKQNLKEVDDKARGFVGFTKDAAVRSYATAQKAREEPSEKNVSTSEQLQRQLERCQAMEKVVGKLSALQQRSEWGAELAMSYEREREGVEERNGKLVKRKAAKARVGLDIVKEVEELVAEARGLTDSVGERRGL